MDQGLANFFGKQSDEERKEFQGSVNNASDKDQTRPKLIVSGKYIMEAQTYAFRMNDAKKSLVVSPNVGESGKGSLMLTISLGVVDGTTSVPSGAYVLTNIVLAPKSGANSETMANTSKMMKPRLSALLGHSDIDISPEWIHENLMADFQEVSEGQFKLVKDHKMKQRVMVVCEDDMYNGNCTINVKSIVPAKPGDKSVSNVTQASHDDGESQGFGGEDAPTTASDMQDGQTPGDVPNIDPGTAGVQESTTPPDMPAASEDF